MKLICTSDWHLDWKTAGLSRFDDISQAILQTVAEAKEQDVDAYVFLGDLCDPGSAAIRCVSFAARVAKELSAAGIPSLWLSGNHCTQEDGHGTTVLSPLAAMGLGKVTVVESPRAMFWPPIDAWVVCLPYTPRSHAYDPEAFIDEAAGICTRHPAVVLGHLNIEGIGPGSETKDLPRGRDVFLPIDLINETWPNALVLNGHYHRRQTFRGIEIPGSLCRLTFSEENDESKGWLIVEVGDDAEETKDKPKRKRAPRRKRRAAATDA